MERRKGTNLSGDRDTIGVSTKRMDVVPRPLQRHALIQDAVVALLAGRGEEAHDAEAVIDDDGGHPLLRERRGVVQGTVAQSLLEGTAVDPKLDGVTIGVLRGLRRREDGEVQAVLRDAVVRAVTRRQFAHLQDRNDEWIDCADCHETCDYLRAARRVEVGFVRAIVRLRDCGVLPA